MTRARIRVALDEPAGSGNAPGVAAALGLTATLAAAPVFALMALGTALSGGEADMLCASMGGSPLGGMTLMYLLMSVVHLAPWLRLFAGAISSQSPRL